MIIGKNFLVKVNSNIGNSSLSSSIDEEVRNLSGLQDVEQIRWIFLQEKIFIKRESIL